MEVEQEQVKGMVLNEWNRLIAAVEAEYDADIYFYSAGIDQEGFGLLTQEVQAHSSKKNALLILVTDGGLANYAYQIARFLQEEYDGELIIYCPSRCKSAGTLIALGAHKLLMDTFSELGPLDVQLFKENEIGARKSGLLSKAAFEALAESSFNLYEHLMLGITVKSGATVSFKLASELSAKMASTMMASVYGQINPEVVGSEERDLDVAFHYGCRLARISGNASPNAVIHLVRGYPSHDFIIDAREAAQLFENVDYPSENLYRLVKHLPDHLMQEASPSFVHALKAVHMEEQNDVEIPSADPDEGTGAEAQMEASGGGDRPSDQEPERAPVVEGAEQSPDADEDDKEELGRTTRLQAVE